MYSWAFRVKGWALSAAPGGNKPEETDKWRCVCSSVISTDKLMSQPVIRLQKEQTDFLNCEQTQKGHFAVCC